MQFGFSMERHHHLNHPCYGGLGSIVGQSTSTTRPRETSIAAHKTQDSLPVQPSKKYAHHASSVLVSFTCNNAAGIRTPPGRRPPVGGLTLLLLLLFKRHPSKILVVPAVEALLGGLSSADRGSHLLRDGY